MNPWIDVGWVVVVGAALALLWPYVKQSALLLEQMEREHIQGRKER
jgi:hypothetical protein